MGGQPPSRVRIPPSPLPERPADPSFRRRRMCGVPALWRRCCKRMGSTALIDGRVAREGGWDGGSRRGDGCRSRRRVERGARWSGGGGGGAVGGRRGGGGGAAGGRRGGGPHVPRGRRDAAGAGGGGRRAGRQRRGVPAATGVA